MRTFLFRVYAQKVGRSEKSGALENVRDFQTKLLKKLQNQISSRTLPKYSESRRVKIFIEQNRIIVPGVFPIPFKCRLS